MTIAYLDLARSQFDKHPQPDQPPGKDPMEQREGDGARILIVEDEPSVRRATARILEQRGFQTISAHNGEEALEVVRRGKDEIGLVLTDVVMPRMGGLELHDRLAAVRPNLKVVFMSGSSGQEANVASIRKRGLPFLEKPFMPDELVGMILAALGEVAQ